MLNSKNKKDVNMIKRFLDDCLTEYDEFTLGLSAGYIDEDGIICNEQMGAKATFSVGMPVYSENGEELGRLSVGLWKNLNYAQEKVGFDIPVECWRIDGYKGERQNVNTYYQVHQDNSTNKKGL